jgi:hypothetical protein
MTKFLSAIAFVVLSTGFQACAADASSDGSGESSASASAQDTHAIVYPEISVDDCGGKDEMPYDSCRCYLELDSSGNKQYGSNGVALKAVACDASEAAKQGLPWSN